MYVQDSSNRETLFRDTLMKSFEAVAEKVRGFSRALQVKVKSEKLDLYQTEMEDIEQIQFKPFLQSKQDLTQIQFSLDNIAHLQYTIECCVTKQEQPG